MKGWIKYIVLLAGFLLLFSFQQHLKERAKKETIKVLTEEQVIPYEKESIDSLPSGKAHYYMSGFLQIAP